jgi:MoaD family protein
LHACNELAKKKYKGLVKRKPKIFQWARIIRVTMEITVSYFTVLRSITEKRQEKIKIEEDSTFEDILAILVKRYGKNFERYVSSGEEKKGLPLVFLLNGQDIWQFNGLKTRLHDGDNVALMPPIAGG